MRTIEDIRAAGDERHPAAGTFEVRSPADLSVIATVPEYGPGAVAAAVARLRAAQPAWEALGADGRVAHVSRFRDWLLDNEEEIASVLQRETGKAWQDALLEVTPVCDLINYYANRAARFLADSRRRPHGLLTATKKLTVAYRPYPVVGVICPWNFPVALALVDSIPALLAGAAVAVKPSEFTPLATQRLVEGWREIGAPDVLACLTGAGATGGAVVDEVDYVQFTGSARTGRRVAVRAAERLIPCSLELGGKDAMIVLADAHVERAANGAVYGAMWTSGQVCNSVERAYVEDAIYDDFVRRVSEKVAALRQGADDQSFRADVGAMATAAQVQIVERHVADAVTKGARVLTGGGRAAGDGLFYAPTVLVDVDHTMDCMREETFGPVLPIMRVADADEAVGLANDSRYGLSASVWTRDKRRGERLARRIDVGAVNVNDVFANMFCYPLPQAGWKESGIGARSGGADGMRRYCRPQAITSARLTAEREQTWFPYGPHSGRRVQRLLRLLVARGRRRFSRLRDAL